MCPRVPGPRDTGVGTPASPWPWSPLLPRGELYPGRGTAIGLPVVGTCQRSGWEGGLAESPCGPAALSAPPRTGTRALAKARAGPSPGRGSGQEPGIFQGKPCSQSWQGAVPTPPGGATPSSGCGVAVDVLSGRVWSPFSHQQKQSYWPKVQNKLSEETRGRGVPTG